MKVIVFSTLLVVSTVFGDRSIPSTPSELTERVEAAFAAAGIIARQKMGEAIGLQGSALAEFMQTDQQRIEIQKQATEDQAKADTAAAAEQAKMWGTIGIVAGAVIVAIGAGLYAAVSGGALTGVGIAKTVGAMVAGGIAGAAAGASSSAA